MEEVLRTDEVRTPVEKSPPRRRGGLPLGLIRPKVGVLRVATPPNHEHHAVLVEHYLSLFYLLNNQSSRR